jgi:hypothetical protein
MVEKPRGCHPLAFQEDSVFLAVEIAAVTTDPGQVSLPGSYTHGISERFSRQGVRLSGRSAGRR